MLLVVRLFSRFLARTFSQLAESSGRAGAPEAVSFLERIFSKLFSQHSRCATRIFSRLLCMLLASRYPPRAFSHSLLLYFFTPLLLLSLMPPCLMRFVHACFTHTVIYATAAAALLAYLVSDFTHLVSDLTHLVSDFTWPDACTGSLLPYTLVA